MLIFKVLFGVLGAFCFLGTNAIHHTAKESYDDLYTQDTLRSISMVDTFLIFDPETHEESQAVVKQSFRGTLNSEEENLVRSMMKRNTFDWKLPEGTNNIYQEKDTVIVFDPVTYKEKVYIIDKEIELTNY